MSTGDGKFRFIQISDLYLDSRQACRDLRMPAARRLQRNQERVQCLARACEIARLRRADAVFIPGCLFEHATASSVTFNRVLEILAGLDQIPAYISPGRTDPWSIDSYYAGTAAMARGVRDIPANVHIFSTDKLVRTAHPARGDVLIWGRACLPATVSTRLFASYNQIGSEDKDKINILIAHGLLDDIAESNPVSLVSSPLLGAKELDERGFTWAALGGFHKYREVRHHEGSPMGAYAGTPSAVQASETGPRHAIFGTIARAASGSGYHIDTELVEMDRRRLVNVPINIAGVKPNQLVEHARKILDTSAARGDDMVAIKLTGTYAHGTTPAPIGEALCKRYFHLVIDNRTRPDYLVGQVDQRTTEGKFIEVLLNLRQKAEARGGSLPIADYTSPLSVRAIEDALYFGLDALKHNKVTPRDVD